MFNLWSRHRVSFPPLYGLIASIALIASCRMPFICPSFPVLYLATESNIGKYTLVNGPDRPVPTKTS